MSHGLADLPREPVDRLSRPFARFLRIEAAASVLLLACVVVALAASNSQWSAQYAAFWDTPIGIMSGEIVFSRSIKHWIGDAAMTLFFFVVALELKREIVLGELSTLRMAGFSMAAALGGMLVPALIFLSIERGESAARGWGVVMATDTAFVIGCLALLGRRVPAQLRIFLLSVAIFDDVGAIMVIAIGYGGRVDGAAIAWAVVALTVIVVLNRIGIRRIPVYALFGALVWLAFDRSGIHPTLAGVVIGLMTPARSWVKDSRLQAILARVGAYPQGEHWSGDTVDRQDLRRAGVAAREALSPLERLEMTIHPWVAFVVLPVFALSHAGLPLSTAAVDWRLASAVTIGLFCGKPLGVVLFAFLATRLRVGTRPEGLSWPHIAGGALLTGIGFTMALLIAELALDAEHLDSGKVGIIGGSVLSAVCGVLVLARLTSGHGGGGSGAGSLAVRG